MLYSCEVINAIYIQLINMIINFFVPALHENMMF